MSDRGASGPGAPTVNVTHCAKCAPAQLDDAGARAYALFWKLLVHVVFMEMADAAELCEQGAEILRAEGELWELAGTLGFLARGARGDREQALRLISEAEALYQRMGMPKLLAITRALRP